MRSSYGKPLITVVTVVLNGRSSIESTIQSVLSQSYKYLEYIVIDGGSTDGTHDIIRKYQDRIDYWLSEKDNGIYDAMNKGIKLGRGEWIGILNADDTYHRHALERVAQEVVCHEDIGVIYSNIAYDTNRRKNVLLRAPSMLKLSHFWRTPLYHPAMFVKRTIYKKYGTFDPTYLIAGDYELMLRYFLAGVVFRYVEDILADMKMGGASMRNVAIGSREVRQIAKRYGIFTPKFAASYYVNKLKIVIALKALKSPVIGEMYDMYRRLKFTITKPKL